ncbi:uncharacterized protein A4U43_C08F15940 [Asparagus officinalis]|nr:uncharacterized protein A4U43_C08F15940 [Asparagus officinalis]
MDFESADAGLWKEALSSYPTCIASLNKPDLISLDSFYRCDLPLLLPQRNPSPFITQPELHQLMRWKLTRGKWRPRLLDFVASLEGDEVEGASRRAFEALPDLEKAVKELTVLKGELSMEGEVFTASDVERALWSSAAASKVKASATDNKQKYSTKKSTKRKRNP